MELIKPDININFIGKRYLAFAASGLLILMTVIVLAINGGPRYGVDFAGGVLVQVRFAKPTDAGQIKKALAPLGMADATVQFFGGDDKREFLVRTEKQDMDMTGLGDKINQTLAQAYGQGEFDVRRVEMVGPKVGHDLREKALLAILYSILMIAVYISGRFEGKWALSGLMAAALVGVTLLVEAVTGGAGAVTLIVIAMAVTVLGCWYLKLRYALGAIVALIHDVIITVGVFSLLGKEFTLATVAAILTIIGYSLNDTIIVFDRIRENLTKSGGGGDLAQTINTSVNQTLSRTILTSGTTLMVLLCLYTLGGGVIEDFALALLVGIGVGTYSSVFVASPVLLLLPEGKPRLPFGGEAAAKAEPAKVAPAAKAQPAAEAGKKAAPATKAQSAAKASANKQRQGKARGKRR